ncbi:unnamed protein product [Acanthoscelides obtectus]|uniref:Uncharacterized protein n=1 Tax=Acanthoscelides obtectus TaxID=200917 RepID=A0A9P0KPT2_ACAOB|nr:unnamed protein product [Acanthoscelides obtectus]CAK1646567.1 hypothetical protein AOBTE_LOCUS14718 [Acanthoscelides obtectus]
MIPKLFRAG